MLPPKQLDKDPLDIPLKRLAGKTSSIQLIDKSSNPFVFTTYLVEFLLSEEALPVYLQTKTIPLWESCCIAIAKEMRIKIPPGKTAVETLCVGTGIIPTTIQTDPHLREVVLTQCIKTVTADFCALDFSLQKNQTGALLGKAMQFSTTFCLWIPFDEQYIDDEFSPYIEAMDAIFAHIIKSISSTPDWYQSACASLWTKLGFDPKTVQRLTSTLQKSQILQLFYTYLQHSTIARQIEYPSEVHFHSLTYYIARTVKDHLQANPSPQDPLVEALGFQLDCEFSPEGELISTTPRELKHPAIPDTYPKDYFEKVLTYFRKDELLQDHSLFLSPHIQTIIREQIPQIQEMQIYAHSRQIDAPCDVRVLA